MRPSRPKRHSILIDHETYRRLKAYAEQQGVKLEAVVEVALQDIGRGP